MSLNRSQCYKLLGLNESASINQIKDAYRKLALEYHPDKNTSAKDGEKFKMIAEAYHILREKNNSHVRTYYGTNDSTKNHQYRKHMFSTWRNLFYSKIYYTCMEYVKNVYQDYSEYIPVFLKYYYKTSRNASLVIHYLIRFVHHNHIKVLFLNYLKITKNILT